MMKLLIIIVVLDFIPILWTLLPHLTNCVDPTPDFIVLVWGVEFLVGITH
jgi:hypothetical protein